MEKLSKYNNSSTDGKRYWRAMKVTPHLLLLALSKLKMVKNVHSEKQFITVYSKFFKNRKLCFTAVASLSCAIP